MRSEAKWVIFLYHTWEVSLYSAQWLTCQLTCKQSMGSRWLLDFLDTNGTSVSHACPKGSESIAEYDE